MGGTINPRQYHRECLEKMTYAGVRDENTKNIVGKLVAKQVEIVCDPTMLLPINEFDFPHERKIKDKYMIVYSYSVPKEHPFCQPDEPA